MVARCWKSSPRSPGTPVLRPKSSISSKSIDSPCVKKMGAPVTALLSVCARSRPTQRPAEKLRRVVEVSVLMISLSFKRFRYDLRPIGVRIPSTIQATPAAAILVSFRFERKGSGLRYSPQSTEKQIRHDGCHGRMSNPPTGLKPGKHPIDHSEQQHGQRLDQTGRIKVRPHSRHGRSQRTHDESLSLQDPGAVFGGQKLHVFRQDAMFILRIGVFLDETTNHEPDRRLRIESQRLDLQHDRLESGQMLFANESE